MTNFESITAQCLFIHQSAVNDGRENDGRNTRNTNKTTRRMSGAPFTSAETR
jgi:hypothetical protein